MSRPEILIDDIGKAYRIGLKAEAYSTFRDAITRTAMAPLRRLRKLGEKRTEADTFWALRHVSFEVQPGEVVGIIGRNGAGKSTLLKVLSRITEPTEGIIRLRGRVASLLEVGTGFHPELTGRENIYLNGSILGMKKVEIDRRFDEIVAFSEIGQFLDTAVKHYSSGMYVRLAFAVAAHLDPEILIVDEVLAVGDAAFQKKCLGKMEAVASQQGKTVLFVSHNMSAIQQLCSSAVLIRQGRLVRKGSPDEIVPEYLSDAEPDVDGEIDLSNHPARSPDHQPLLRRMIVRDSSGKRTSTFSPDDQLIIDLLVDTAKPLLEPRLAIAIEDQFGRRIMTMANYFSPSSLGLLQGTAQIRCTIDRLDLGAGRYFLSASIGDKLHGLLDSLDSVTSLTVRWNNYYGNGESYHPVYGPVLKSSTWTYCGDEQHSVPPRVACNE